MYFNLIYNMDINKYIGKRYGRLTIISLNKKEPRFIGKDNPTKNGNNYYFNCKCDCGSEYVAKLCNLNRGHTKSCGCLQKETSIKNISKIQKTMNGETTGEYARLYRIYKGILSRCYNPKCKEYKYYGSKGITIFSEWENDYYIFKEWALSNGYNNSLEIDRINNNGNYEPNNCRWTTRKEQMNNCSLNKMVAYKNKTKTLSQWCDELGINYDRTLGRLNKLHMTVEEAFECEKYTIIHKNIPSSISIVLDNIVFYSIKKCAEKYLGVADSNIQKYLKGTRPMPQKYKDRGLRYYNEEIDKNLPHFMK